MSEDHARKGLWLHIVFVALISLVAYLGVLDGVTTDYTFKGFDKVLHFTFVGGIAFWWTAGWTDPRFGESTIGVALPLAVMVPLAVATFEEGLQFFSPHRNADILDWVADLAGLLGFWLLARWWLKRRTLTAENSA